MEATQANIVVDVKHALSRQSGDELVSELRRMRGVSRASVSSRAPRLLLVDYDPQLTDSQRILGTVVRRGIDARLIGM